MMDVLGDPAFTSSAYTVSEAAELTKVKPATITNWFRAGPGDRPALLFAERARAAGEPVRLSFLELVELAVAGEFRRREIPLRQLRNARDFLLARLDGGHPFAVEDVRTISGRVIHAGGSRAVSAAAAIDAGDDLIQALFDGFEAYARERFDYERGWAIRFFPAGRNEELNVDPHFRGGQLTVSGRGVMARTIAGRFKGGESVEYLADDYEISPAAVQASIRFFAAA